VLVLQKKKTFKDMGHCTMTDLQVVEIFEPMSFV